MVCPVGRVKVPEDIARFYLEKLERFAALVEELRQDVRYLPVHELMYQIYGKTGYYDYVASMPAGKDPQCKSGYAGGEGAVLLCAVHQLQRFIPFCKIY